MDFFLEACVGGYIVPASTEASAPAVLSLYAYQSVYCAKQMLHHLFILCPKTQKPREAKYVKEKTMGHDQSQR